MYERVIRWLGRAALAGLIIIGVFVGWHGFSLGIGWFHQGSKLPPGIQKVSIHYHPGRQQPDQYATVTNVKEIQKIVRVFNALPVEPQSYSRDCAADFGQYVDVTFFPATGHSIEVHDWLACLDLRISTSTEHLFDRGGTFSTVVFKALPPS